MVVVEEVALARCQSYKTFFSITGIFAKKVGHNYLTITFIITVWRSRGLNNQTVLHLQCTENGRLCSKLVCLSKPMKVIINYRDIRYYMCSYIINV